MVSMACVFSRHVFDKSLHVDIARESVFFLVPDRCMRVSARNNLDAVRKNFVVHSLVLEIQCTARQQQPSSET